MAPGPHGCHVACDGGRELVAQCRGRSPHKGISSETRLEFTLKTEVFQLCFERLRTQWHAKGQVNQGEIGLSTSVPRMLVARSAGPHHLDKA
ncbi:hypothetical protein DPEC_G00236010 [Dallia pectoralis]|uniref:Uncharacterized protein n=1 Tax=Dallia pectoralis TaxID=75939 RepID=A0ACC2FYH6_DALPE|nr:hypothetical protein DPEC_G00236010 [Dallia pectoralis]